MRLVSIIFAAPIGVTIFVAVKAAYVRDPLGEKTETPGPPASLRLQRELGLSTESVTDHVESAG